MNFWSFLTRPGEKQDEEIRNCSSTPQISLTIFLTFLTAPLQDS